MVLIGIMLHSRAIHAFDECQVTINSDYTAPAKATSLETKLREFGIAVRSAVLENRSILVRAVDSTTRQSLSGELALDKIDVLQRQQRQYREGAAACFILASLASVISLLSYPYSLGAPFSLLLMVSGITAASAGPVVRTNLGGLTNMTILGVGNLICGLLALIYFFKLDIDGRTSRALALGALIGQATLWPRLRSCAADA